MASKALPPRPSLDSLRKQAKKLARDRSVSLRDAQLALAREYGFAGWQDLTAEAHQRLGNDFESAIARARRVIHDNDVEELKRLLAQYPALLSWRSDHDRRGLLGFATGAYGDAFGEQREEWFTRKACAEVLLDAGALVVPSVAEGLLRSRAVGLLQLFQQRGLLPRTLKFFAALGDHEGVGATLAGSGTDRMTVAEAFFIACSYKHEAVAAVLLERSIALDSELGTKIDRGVGRQAFITSFIEKKESLDLRQATDVGPWRAFVMDHILGTLPENDMSAFTHWLQREPWLLADTFVWFQNRIIELASFASYLTDREAVIAALFDRDPAILHRQPPPPSQAIEHAITYGNTHLLPLLTRIWPLPDDLPHAAGVGSLQRVKQWFDASGAPALGDLERHYPRTSLHLSEHDDLRWGAPAVQHVLDTALAFAVINRHFDVADFLLEHGADVNTDWNSHEPASILHHLVFLPNPYASMQYLIDRGIDMTIEDYRWNSTAKGWAKYALQDDAMVRFFEEAERKRQSAP